MLELLDHFFDGTKLGEHLLMMATALVRISRFYGLAHAGVNPHHSAINS